MSLPSTNHDPGFRITRASHVVLEVRDLAASRQFYEKVIREPQVEPRPLTLETYLAK